MFFLLYLILNNMSAIFSTVGICICMICTICCIASNFKNCVDLVQSPSCSTTEEHGTICTTVPPMQNCTTSSLGTFLQYLIFFASIIGIIYTWTH